MALTRAFSLQECDVMDATTEAAENQEQTGSDKDDELLAVVIRFAGDSGDGMQLTGNQFTLASAVSGNDLATFPDFPAEIRAPVGTTFGVSSFQINFGTRKIRTIGDELDVLVAMNPAALITNVEDLRDNGVLIVDKGTFNDRNLAKAGYDENPLKDGSLTKFRLMSIDISELTLSAVKSVEGVSVTNKESLRSKNMWALGLVFWLFERDRQVTLDWLDEKFAKLPDIAKINKAALEAGYTYGDVSDLPSEVDHHAVPPAEIPAGLYRNISGSEGICWGLALGAALAGLNLSYCSYPITPASNMLHGFVRMGADYNISTFQAEDEIAAACAAIGASYAGNLGVTGSSGPGVALKTEAIGLACATELPLIIVNAQRGGPSTGLPTKTEQSDLYQAVYGRNADTPLAVIAASSPGDCFYAAIEAVRISVKYMTPVMLLTDGFIANASEPWEVPDISEIDGFEVDRTLPKDFQPYRRDPDTLSRPWVVPGTKGGIHRIGGIERADGSGNISYDPENHQKMTDIRANKILGIADDIPEQTITQGEATGKLAIVGWGSTYGPISKAVENLRVDRHNVSHIHLRHIWPLPRNLKQLLDGFELILLPEMNKGQCTTLLKAETLIDIRPLMKVSGKPFKASEIEQVALEMLKG
jgi:2-oxoglutarate ferredoxin oxidoreductase subunit alpha